MQNARSLAELARTYQRSLDEFFRLNAEQGWTADAPLPSDTLVNVPDPGFPALLAARFAARALADAALTPGERVRLIQSLAPIAASEPTALDSVLARLVLASETDDAEQLVALAALASASAADAPPEVALQSQLTTFVP